MRLIFAVICVSLGIWLAFNHPDEAEMILMYVQSAFYQLLEFIGQYVSTTHDLFVSRIKSGHGGLS